MPGASMESSSRTSTPNQSSSRSVHAAARWTSCSRLRSSRCAKRVNSTCSSDPSTGLTTIGSRNRPSDASAASIAGERPPDCLELRAEHVLGPFFREITIGRSAYARQTIEGLLEIAQAYLVFSRTRYDEFARLAVEWSHF